MGTERLLRSVGNLPLAIDQVASYIRNTGSSSGETFNIYGSEEAIEVIRKNCEDFGVTVGLPDRLI